MPARFLKISVVWFMACILLGTYMGATHDFAYRQAHVHGNLLGWLSCAVFALAYRAWPRLAVSRLAKPHFWMHNIGVAIFIAGLAALPSGAPAAEPLLSIGSVLICLATACLLASVLRLPSANKAGVGHF